MRHALRCLPLGLAIASTLAFADGSGTLYNEGKAIALKSAYAFRMPDPFDKGKQITRVVFADKAIDAAALKEAGNRDDAIDTQLHDATRVDLNLDADGTVQNVNIHASGYSGSQSGSGWYTLKIKRNDDKRVEGSFRTNDEADKKSGHYYDLTFALDLPAVPAPGTPLPAGGGEPAKAYRAYLAAMDKGDIDALLKTMSRERAEQIAAHRNDPDFKQMFAFIQGERLRDPRIGKGSTKGDVATLEVSGKSGDGQASTGTVTLVKEGGAWKLSKEEMSTHVE
jgi:hypothetical protein